MKQFFKNLFKNEVLLNDEEEAPKSAFPWVFIKSELELQDLQKKSFEQLQVVYKHSTSCGISSMVLRQFQNTPDIQGVQATFYVLDLLSNRGLSNEISSTYGVIHQSPQLLLIKDGAVVAHASHYSILQVNIGLYL